MMNPRRQFLKMLGIGGAAAVVGGTSKVLADKVSEELRTDVSGGIDISGVNASCVKSAEAVSREIRKQYSNVLQDEIPLSTRIIEYNYSKRLEYKLFTPFEFIDTLQPDHITINQWMTPKSKKKRPWDEVDFDRLVCHQRTFNTQSFYKEVVISPVTTNGMTPADIFFKECEPAISELANLLNEGGYKYSFPLEELHSPGMKCRVHTTGTIPVRVTVQYDVNILCRRLTMEVLVA